MIFQVRDDVQSALAQGVGVVALETAVLTHGLPYPDNLATMAKMAEAVRAAGAVPAVVGVRAGTLVVGLDQTEWPEILPGAEKCSIRDLGPVAARGGNGGTTVAATAYAAHRANIAVFATGGIGGVHRGVVDTWDVSADLYALARLPVVIVSSGIKSILDVPKTMEFLESLGIAVTGYQTRELPGFYTTASGIPLSESVRTPAEAAAVYRAMRDLGLPASLLVTKPGPEGMPTEMVEALIGRALLAAGEAGVVGKATTPFLLDYLNREAGDRLLSANVALLESNARLAGEISMALHA
ncbi:MAG: pseudouridine-5'-phosphate glycosidase [Thermaerobacter sp.]|nr:pseudouridine-5'-phosphate glycosidase [Thermaerobacter sp.]